MSDAQSDLIARLEAAFLAGANEEERWARALCVADAADPDKIIGYPPNPRWKSYASYARISMRAAALLKAIPSASHSLAGDNPLNTKDTG